MSKIVIDLTNDEIETMNELRERLDVDNNTMAVATALSITAELAKVITGGDTLQVVNSEGEVETIRIEGLN